MSASSTIENGLDLTRGVTLADFDGRPMMRGHVGKKPVLLARVGDEILAVGARCTHYGGSLEHGLLTGDKVRCPLHHACFSLRTGEALGAPAFDPLPCWSVEREGDRIVVRDKVEGVPKKRVQTSDQPRAIVIIGGGAAGFACAEMLRRRGYDRSLTMLSDDADTPCDRPNLSKDYLAGEAPDDWMPLRPDDFYRQNDIDLRLSTSVAGIDTTAQKVMLADGGTLSYDRLLIATGAEPVLPSIPGVDLPHVFTLRSFADGRAIAAAASAATSAVVLGSGFIGLETAAALRGRELAVDVVSLDDRPLGKVLGRALGNFIRGLHEEHGVTFHMKTSIAAIAPDAVTLSTGERIAADLVVVGIGVRPRTALAEAANLAVGQGILVDEYLETAVDGVYAAGDVVRFPGGPDKGMIRVEHWVVAQRQGQTAAENMLGARISFDDTPFFWSAHYDTAIRYVGHADSWDEVVIDGDILARDARVSYGQDGRLLAVATIGRDVEALSQGQRIAGSL